MSTKSPRQIAEDFAEQNLAELSANVLHWRKAGRLPAECPFHDLGILCTAFAPDYEYQEAENIIILLALKKVANS